MLQWRKMIAPAAEPRLARNYRLIYDIVRGAGLGRHLVMAEVYEYARREQPRIGFSTVYRALARLHELGLVSEIRLPGADSAYYEVAGKPHAHFRCERCGAVADVDYVPPQRLVRELGRRHGVEIDDVLLSLHGRCATCAAAESPAARGALAGT
ncbi:MAG: transcriptional repressor [Candidatus Baltobacteraceae bacterium]